MWRLSSLSGDFTYVYYVVCVVDIFLVFVDSFVLYLQVGGVECWYRKQCAVAFHPVQLLLYTYRISSVDFYL